MDVFKAYCDHVHKDAPKTKTKPDDELFELENKEEIDDSDNNDKETIKSLEQQVKELSEKLNALTSVGEEHRDNPEENHDGKEE